MTSPFSYTPRTSSTPYRALASLTWSSSSSSWPSDPGPSSSPPPVSPVPYTNPTTTIHSPSPYFTYLNARYDRNMGRERELQRELEMERVSYSAYNNGKGKLVARDPETGHNFTPPRQTLPSFKELFGDIRLSNLSSSRNISSSSSSISSSWSSASPPAVEASHLYHPARQTQNSPIIQPSTTLPEHVFYSSSEEDDTEDYFRHRIPFRYSQEPSLAEQPFSDEEEEGQRKNDISTQDTYSFSPERRRSTTFETSSERGLWTKTILPQTIQHQKRSSEPAISLPSSLPTSVQDCESLKLFRSPPRHVSEPAPGWDSLHQDHSFVHEKSITPSISPPMQPRELSLPPSSLPPSSPVFASSPVSFEKSLPDHSDDIIPSESDCASITEDDRYTSLPEDEDQPTEDVVMDDIESSGDDSHETQGGFVTY
ncbi:hypothetical protein L218DRAFT_616427 [Marasmius fiardii PR-910]|nr:hypothetical protein L218DRAFT_616427 [Marasmius fiardii PR-910]